MHYAIAVLSKEKEDVKKLLAPYKMLPGKEGSEEYKYDYYNIGGVWTNSLIKKGSVTLKS